MGAAILDLATSIWRITVMNEAKKPYLNDLNSQNSS